MRLQERKATSFLSEALRSFLAKSMSNVEVRVSTTICGGIIWLNRYGLFYVSVRLQSTTVEEKKVSRRAARELGVLVEAPFPASRGVETMALRTYSSDTLNGVHVRARLPNQYFRL